MSFDSHNQVQSILLKVRFSLWMHHISDSVSCSGTKVYTRTFATIWSRFMNTSMYTTLGLLHSYSGYLACEWRDSNHTYSSMSFQWSGYSACEWRDSNHTYSIFSTSALIIIPFNVKTRTVEIYVHVCVHEQATTDISLNE